MKLLESIKLALQVFPNSFINRNNEIILIPKFDVYIQLDDVKTNEDFKVKLCEWLSRDCSCALRYSQDKRLIRYWQDNTNAFNKICGTNFTMKQMSYIYTYLGNGIKHELTRQFVRNGFDLFVIEKFVIIEKLNKNYSKLNKKIKKMNKKIKKVVLLNNSTYVYGDESDGTKLSI